MALRFSFFYAMFYNQLPQLCFVILKLPANQPVETPRGWLLGSLDIRPLGVRACPYLPAKVFQAHRVLTVLQPWKQPRGLM